MLRHHTSLSPQEKALFKKLSTPAKIQDFLEAIPWNFEKDGPTLQSPRTTILRNSAHCFEGALLSSAILSFHGHTPIILDLQPNIESKDDGHALALFTVDGLFGALSKTNHASVRYRDPVYKSVRELVMSYFHEYFLDDGIKNLRSYTLLNLEKIQKNWITDVEPVWYIEEMLSSKKYTQILPPSSYITLRKAEQVEIDTTKHPVWE